MRESCYIHPRYWHTQLTYKHNPRKRRRFVSIVLVSLEKCQFSDASTIAKRY